LILLIKVQTDLFGHSDHLLIRYLFQAVANVPGDLLVEKSGLLTDNSERTSQMAQFVVADVDAFEEDSSSGRSVEA
jgi:hypothetical protein